MWHALDVSNAMIFIRLARLAKAVDLIIDGSTAHACAHHVVPVRVVPYP